MKRANSLELLRKLFAVDDGETLHLLIRCLLSPRGTPPEPCLTRTREIRDLGHDYITQLRHELRQQGAPRQ